MDIPAEVIQQGKLAWLVWSLEHDGVEPECVDKPFGICRVQASILIEQSDALCAFTRFDDELDGARIEPFLPLFNPYGNRVVGETAVVFLAKFHLNVEAATPGRGNNLTGIEIALSESLSAFDSRDADIRAQIQVGGKFSLRHGDFERSSASHCGHAVLPGQRHLRPR